MSEKPLNPGSQEAYYRGCSCPVLENGHGLGILGGTVTDKRSGLPLFWINANCPLHGTKPFFPYRHPTF